MGWWQRAFAVRPSRPWRPTAEEDALIDNLAEAIVRREMTAPAMIGLEMCRPLNYVGSQALYVLTPLLSPFASAETLTRLAHVLEHREAIDLICERIEKWERRVARPSSRDDSVTRDAETPAAYTEQQQG